MRQSSPFTLGSLIQANSARVLIALSLTLLLLCIALKSAKFDSQLSAWVQRTNRIDNELNSLASATGDSDGTSSLLLLQTPRHEQSDILTVDALMIHLEAMAIASHITVDLFDVPWTIKDICMAPTPPDHDLAHVSLILENLMPCAIKTPLDCFWEGSKLIGSEQSATLGSHGPILKWTSLNPMLLVEKQKEVISHSFLSQSLIDWMQRVGITTGYQEKPCLYPADPNCPITAPNKISNKPPDIGAYLTGGCRGFASKLMHWREEEIVSGIVRNKTGHIIKAAALQSTIQLMSEADMFDYWRKTHKVNDIHNWSTGSAKLVLETWLQKFKEELAQFVRTSPASNSFKLHAMTPKSLFQPTDALPLVDLTNFELCFILMTVFTCFTNPNLINDHISISRLRIILLAILNSSFIGFTFIASLGLSSFMNLNLNMATTQILPPLALYYGFKQYITIANIYSQKFKYSSKDELTTECLNEFFPVIFIESLCYIIPLLIVSILPVAATRIFAFQAITYIILSSVVAITLIPALFSLFILHHLQQLDDQSDSNCELNNLKSTESANINSSSKRRTATPKGKTHVSVNFEDQILSRIEHDLKNIKANSKRSIDTSFTAHVDIGHSRTSFRMRSYPSEHQEEYAEQISSNMCNTNKQTGVTEPRCATNLLPDLLICALPKPEESNKPNQQETIESKSELKTETKQGNQDKEDNDTNVSKKIFEFYSNNLITNRFIKSIIMIARIIIIVAILAQANKVRYGLQVRDIIIRGTSDYEAFYIQEKYFPIFNSFIITRGNIDYASNQRLLYELFKKIEQVDGVLKNDNENQKFWLPYFRDWLTQLQQKFDNDRNKSLISVDGWTQGASDDAKLAYKLLAQTGRVDNPIDKNLVETNRLVDTNGIINQKAFYYYLSAWVMNDAFTYSMSESNFRPEPKLWNDNPDDLRIDKARPLTYTQIPFLLKLPSSHDNLRTIQEIRAISQAFEQLNIQNFPAGIPFIFWDQFMNLDLLFFTAIIISFILVYVGIGIVTTNFITAAIVSVPMFLSLLELYGLIGHLYIPFNNILAVLMIGTIGMSVVQTIHYTSYFDANEGDHATRVQKSIEHRFRELVTILILYFICVYVFANSKIDFMIGYSNLLLYLGILNSFNSLLVTPIILSWFGSNYVEFSSSKQSSNRSDKVFKIQGEYKHNRSRKKRNYPRIQSEISLSTISEEPQSEACVHDLKLDFSIRCY